MTELIPVERLAERVSGKSCSGYPKWLVPLIREDRRNTLEAAAKAACWLCRKEGPPAKRLTNSEYGHKHAEVCYAADIYAMLDELNPALAGQT